MKIPAESPFGVHRDKVLGHYSTASWLRRVVMALWSGSTHPVSLSPLGTLDAAHYAAFNEMLDHYRRYGESDPALRRLVSEIDARMQAERAAEERDKALEAWCAQVKRELRAVGRPTGDVDDRYSWYEAQFDAGAAPGDVARASQQ
jgi:hypothetical protein